MLVGNAGYRRFTIAVHPSDRTPDVCLAIPGQVIEIVDDLNRLAKVDVAGVRRNVNVGLLDSERRRASGRETGC